jgi:hypothetical protein
MCDLGYVECDDPGRSETRKENGHDAEVLRRGDVVTKRIPTRFVASEVALAEWSRAARRLLLSGLLLGVGCGDPVEAPPLSALVMEASPERCEGSQRIRGLSADGRECARRVGQQVSCPPAETCVEESCALRCIRDSDCPAPYYCAPPPILDGPETVELVPQCWMVSQYFNVHFVSRGPGGERSYSFDDPELLPGIPSVSIKHELGVEVSGPSDAVLEMKGFEGVAAIELWLNGARACAIDPPYTGTHVSCFTAIPSSAGDRLCAQGVVVFDSARATLRSSDDFDVPHERDYEVIATPFDVVR